MFILFGGVGTVRAEFNIDQVELRAQLSPVRFTTLAAEFGARVTQLVTQEGQRFNKGDLLVDFDCSLQRAQLRSAEATLAGAQNIFQGQRALSELGAIGEVELRSAQIDVDKAKADMSYLRTLISKCRINAPFDGRVGTVSAQAEQFVQPGQPLIEIFDDSSLELSFLVPSRWLAWFKEGYPFEVFIDETGLHYPAKLIRTAGRADPVSQTIRAFAKIDGEFSELLAGMSGEIKVRPPD